MRKLDDWLDGLATRVDKMRRELALLKEEPVADIRLQLDGFEQRLEALVREIDEGVDGLHTHRRTENPKPET